MRQRTYRDRFSQHASASEHSPRSWRYLLCTLGLITSSGLVQATGGCALVVGADFGDKELKQECENPTVEQCETEKEDENCDGVSVCTGDSVFAKSFGDTEEQSGALIALDPMGNIILAASARGMVSYGGDPIGVSDNPGGPDLDIHLVKLDSAGNHIWSKSFGDSDDQHIRGLVVDNEGDIFISGLTYGIIDFGGTPMYQGGGDIFAAKISSEGNTIWSKLYGDGAFQDNLGLAIDRDGNIVLTGYVTDGSIDFGNSTVIGPTGGADSFVAKFDRDLNPLWVRQFDNGPGLGDNYIYGVATGPAGEIAITGRFYGIVDYGGGQFNDVDTQGDGFLAVYTSDGTHAWSKEFDSLGDTGGYSVAIGDTGNVVVVGGFNDYLGHDAMTLGGGGNTDAFVLSYNPDGSLRWEKRLGESQDQVAYEIKFDKAGYLVIGGWARGAIAFEGDPEPANGERDAFVAKLDQNGKVFWGALYGDATEQAVSSATTDELGNVIATGWFVDNINFGDTILTTKGGRDIWLAKLRP